MQQMSDHRERTIEQQLRRFVGTRAADPHALSESEADELRRLRKEVVELRTDKEILKRAGAYFARETMR
jgi:transposase-like protein